MTAFEQQHARHMAPSVAPVIVNSGNNGLLQRKCASDRTPGMDGECAACRKQRLQHKSAGQTEPSSVSPIVRDVLRSPGQPLDAETRAFMEPRFGHDFGAVRIHSDTRAAESARAVDALAYTVNQDIVFGPGQYCTHSTGGRRLLAHELTHTLQQQHALRGDQTNLTSAEAEAHRMSEASAMPLGMLAAPNIRAYSTGLYRQTAGGSSSVAPSTFTGMTLAEFERTMRKSYATTTIRTGTQAEQTAEVASRVRQPALAITLPKWQSWDPGASSQVYDLILESLEGFQSSFEGVPVIREIIFFDTHYEVNLNSAGVAIPQANSGVGASFGAGVLTIYRALTVRDKALPVARSNSQGSYPQVVVGVGGIPGQTPGAPLPLPSREESIRRLVTHELGHGLAEAAMSRDPGMFTAYRRAVGWTDTQPPRLFDIGQQAVQYAFEHGLPPPPQFEITVNNWNSPNWDQQPVSNYMVEGGPSEDFAEAVMTFVRAPNLLLDRSSRRFSFLWDRKGDWLPALLQVPQLGDFPLPTGDQWAV
jgi:hypothetical protein